MKRLTLFTRERCHLCHDAHAALTRIQGRVSFELAIVDLDREAEPEKKREYDHEVPVVELEGRKIMKYRVDEARLLRLLSD
jgi:glutaredoxin